MVRRSDPVPNDSKPLKGFVTPAKTAARADFLVADAVPAEPVSQGRIPC